MDAASIGATGIRAAGNLLSLALSSQWRRGDFQTRWRPTP